VEVFLASVVIFLLAVLGMSIGTIFGGRPFKGSCRGTCGHCGHTPPHDGCRDGRNPQHACGREHDAKTSGDDAE